MPAPSATAIQALPTIKEWKEIVAPHTQPSGKRATWQVVNSIGAYLALWIAMYFTLAISYWLTFALAILAGGLLVRIFIIFHDCGHGSFYKSQKLNHTIGFLSGLLTFTPYFHWRWEHSVHHSASGDLDRRGTGDVWTMTVKEYTASSKLTRLGYRCFRNPFFLFLFGPLYLFIVRERFPSAGASKRSRHSVWWMDLAIATLAVVLISIYGLLPYLLIQGTAITVAASAGVWLFYVQHQYEGVYWERAEDWDYTAAALEGSSFYKLPGVLQWFSGNIGFHHIHHLSSRIPNYNLERCHNSHAIFTNVEPVTFFQGFKSLGYRLWDEEERKLVGFRAIRHLPRTKLQDVA